jgi:hypothetical protein
MEYPSETSMKFDRSNTTEKSDTRAAHGPDPERAEKALTHAKADRHPSS